MRGGQSSEEIKQKKGNKRRKRNYLETIQSDRMFQSEGWIN